MSRLELVVLVASLLLLGFIVEVVRRRRLSEGYALLWIAVGVGVLLLGVVRPLVDRVSRLVGVSYGANLVFAVALVFLVVVCVNLSMHVSRPRGQGPDPGRGGGPAARPSAAPRLADGGRRHRRLADAPAGERADTVDTASSAGDDDPGR